MWLYSMAAAGCLAMATPVKPFHCCTPAIAPSLCRVYIAFDEDDRVYGVQSLRDAVDEYVSQAVAAEDAKRWHPRGYRPGVTVDHTTLLVTVHWVSERHCLCCQ